MSTSIIDTNQPYDFAANIKDKTKPTEKDKEILLNKLNKQLNEDEHLHIFMEILQNLEKRIYSITENGTLFDLNDLPPEAFWKIAYIVYLSINNHERQKTIDAVNQQALQDAKALNVDFTNKLDQYQKDPNNALSSDISHLTEYEKLRVNALSHCSYSTYSKSNGQSLGTGMPIDDKKMEKTIYSDTYKHKWKADDKKITILPKIEMKSVQNNALKNETKATIESEEVDEDEDEDDMMVNGDEVDDNGGIDKDELDKLKNKLFSKPKTKLTLKTMSNSYTESEEMEDNFDESL